MSEATLPRLIIVDECLRNEHGHQAGFVHGLVEWATEAGREVEVWTHARIKPDLLPEWVRVRPVFQDCWVERLWKCPRCWRPLAILQHNRELARTFGSLAEEIRPDDVVLACDTNLFHLLAWRWWRRRHAANTRLMVLLVQPPWLLQPASEPGAMRPGKLAWVYCRALRSLLACTPSGWCRLATDAPQSAMVLREALGTPVPAILLPPSSEFLRQDAPLPADQGELRLGFFGRPTRGRGFRLFLETVKQWLAANHSEASLRFVVHWHATLGAEPEDQAMLRHLHETYPEAIEVVEGSLSDSEYWRILASLHAAVICGDPREYADRTSNLASELSCLGRPMIVTAGTLCGERMAAHGAGVPCAYSVEALSGAFRALAKDYAQLSSLAWARRGEAREHYGWERFARAMDLLPAPNPGEATKATAAQVASLPPPRLRGLPPAARWMLLTGWCRESNLRATWVSTCGSGLAWRWGKTALFLVLRFRAPRRWVRRRWWRRLKLPGKEIAHGTSSSVVVDPADAGRVLKLDWQSANESPEARSRRLTFLNESQQAVRSHLGEFAWETRFESRQFGSPTEAINVVVQSQPRLDGAVWDAARPKSGPAGITGSSRLHRQWRELCARAQLLYLKTGRLLDLAGRDNVLVWSGPQGDCLRLVDTIPISAGADPVPHLEVMRRGLGQTR